jgi:hypothetical protein
MTQKIKLSKDAKDTIKVLAKKAEMSTGDLDDLMKVIIHEQTELGVPEDQLSDRVERRMQATLKKKLKKGGKTVTVVGSILGKSRAIDRAKKHHNIASKYIEKFGESVALDDGYINKAGEHLYKDDKYKAGKVIPDHDWEADGYGVIEIPVKDSDDDIRFADIKLRGDVALAGMVFIEKDENGRDKKIEYPALPQFQECEMDVFVVSKTDDNKFRVTLSKEPKVLGEGYIDLEKIIDFVKTAYPERVLKTLKGIEKFHIEAQKDSVWNPWVLVNGDVVSVSTNDKGWVVNINDKSLKAESDDDDVNDLGIFFNDTMPIDLSEIAANGYFLVSPYERKDNEGMGLGGLGYWVFPWDRAQNKNVTEAPDVGNDTWG